MGAAFHRMTAAHPSHSRSRAPFAPGKHRMGHLSWIRFETVHYHPAMAQALWTAEWSGSQWRLAQSFVLIAAEEMAMERRVARSLEVRCHCDIGTTTWRMAQ